MILDARSIPAEQMLGPPRSRSYCLLSCLALFGAGLFVGWPTLDAGYLSGDDENLIFNHALVNHPSWSHALMLFEIVHRDLYQPIPLLTFQVEFLCHGGNLALMHLTNVGIHIANGLLVWLLLRRMTSHRLVPLIAALLLIVHPLSVECMAWLNGRMIMLSTSFTLGSLIVFDSWWLGRQTHGQRVDQATAALPNVAKAILFLLLALLAMMSKIRVGLPALVVLIVLWRTATAGGGPRAVVHGVAAMAAYFGVALIVVLAPVARFPLLGLTALVYGTTILLRRQRIDFVMWLLWGAVAVLTLVFFIVNLDATQESRMFEGAEKQLLGPNGARVLLALGWYATHYLWPAGLAPYYAPPKEAAWVDGGVLLSLAIIAIIGLAVALSWRRSAVGVCAALWFMVTVASTLPFFPARNLLVADRYVYLPNIALHCVAATLLVWGCSHLSTLYSGRGRVAALGGVTALLIAAAVVSRGVTEYYDNDLAKVQRIFEISPDHPTILTTWGWYAYQQGDYDSALRKANKELAVHSADDVAFCRAMNLRAMSRYALYNDVEGAESDLRSAAQRAAPFAKSYFRLGLIYSERGRQEEAIEQLEIAVAKAPAFNPALNLLGKIYRRRGNTARAAQLYGMAVESSKGYDLEAINALGEIEIEEGHYEEAIRRYESLLDWHPTDIPARTNLALALRALKRYDEALEQYARLLATSPSDRRVLVRAADLLRSLGQHQAALNLWLQALRAEPDAADLLGWCGLHQWYIGDLAAARDAARRARQRDAGEPIARLSILLADIADRRPHAIADGAESILREPAEVVEPLFAPGYEALEYCARLDPQSPWPYYVTAVFLLAEQRYDLARQVAQDFAKLCADPTWHRRLDKLIEQTIEQPTTR